MILVCILGLVRAPAFAGLQSASVTLASCAGGGSEAGVDLIAAGIVEEVSVSPASSLVKVRVDRVYGGDGAEAGDTVKIRTSSGSTSGNSVDVSFEEGARYRLYLKREGDAYTTSICSGTQQLSGPVVPEQAASGETVPGAPAMPQTGGPNPKLLVALAGLLVSGIGALAWRRAR